ncbi:uncharacterized protein H6S33_003497 [Morchella sextelata]|uniref:uncharacterized protein n=1 Tax=Morchella sextelata TaxID=1174677 RepID=UPI001D04A6D4|nr:uncharacterized protein H6S33_003497 [Morchella sextelata]KAH0606663.1 hypothetical protein H6S33_003497 [Morchella sextelata]
MHDAGRQTKPSVFHMSKSVHSGTACPASMKLSKGVPDADDFAPTTKIVSLQKSSDLAVVSPSYLGPRKEFEKLQGKLVILDNSSKRDAVPSVASLLKIYLPSTDPSRLWRTVTNNGCKSSLSTEWRMIEKIRQSRSMLTDRTFDRYVQICILPPPWNGKGWWLGIGSTVPRTEILTRKFTTVLMHTLGYQDRGLQWVLSQALPSKTKPSACTDPRSYMYGSYPADQSHSSSSVHNPNTCTLIEVSSWSGF